jgi:hypothetical protein
VGIIPLFLVSPGKTIENLRGKNTAFLWICFIFLVTALVAAFNAVGFELLTGGGGLSFYVNVVIVAIFAFWRIQIIQNLRGIFRYGVVPLLYLIFCMMIFPDWHFSPFVAGCRMRDVVGLPFGPPLIFSAFTLLSFIGWKNLNGLERFARYGLVALAIVIAMGIMDARGILLAFLFCVLALATYLTFSQSEGQPRASYLIGASVLGVVLGWWYLSAHGCGVSRIANVLTLVNNLVGDRVVELLLMAAAGFALFFVVRHFKGSGLLWGGGLGSLRILALFGVTLSFLGYAVLPFVGLSYDALGALPQDGGITPRLQMYGLAVEHLSGHAVLGRGIDYPIYMVKTYLNSHFAHLHSAYLTWYLSGGVFHLAAGFLFVFGVHFWRNKKYGFDWLVSFCATSLLFGVSSITDNFLTTNSYVTQYIILIYMMLKLQEEHIDVEEN